MAKLVTTMAALLLILAGGPTAAAELTVDEILDRVERRYRVPGFSARFLQSSTIKAMEITDTASGRIFVKRPDRMRWEYDTPEPQVIVSDGKQLWIHRPEDRQVMVGRAPDFFGGGRGAGFLADIGGIRANFDIRPAADRAEGHHVLRLVPRKKSVDLAEVYVWVDNQSYRLARIITYNAWEDETRIDLSHFRVEADLEDQLFDFTVPEGTDIYRLEESQ